jgi:hypothetical protein
VSTFLQVHTVNIVQTLKDDGSCFYKTNNNFLVYGNRGMKNDFGGHDNHHFGNIYAYAGIGLSVCATLDGHEDLFEDNYVVLTGDNVGSPGCQAPGKTLMVWCSLMLMCAVADV